MKSEEHTRAQGLHTAHAGFSLIELLIVVSIILIIAAIALPNFLRARMQGNEAAAVSTLRTINGAAIVYAATYTDVAQTPNCGYPNSLAALGPGAPPSAATADMIDAVVAAGSKSGYLFVYVRTSSTPQGCGTAYTLNANPETPGTTGQRYFYTDPSGIIRQNTAGPATIADPPI